jgi:DNA adenine methylase
LAFGGKVRGATFGVDPRTPARFDVTKLGPLLEAVHERLAGVVIERLPWSAFLARYDRPGTLFYLDPPYFDCEGDYGEGMFERADFERMADQLAHLKGRFILSLNDHPEVRRVFARFAFEEAETTYTVGGGSKAKTVGELVITG